MNPQFCNRKAEEHSFGDPQRDAFRRWGKVEDINERALAEGRLREYEKAVEGVEEMIAVVDRDYRYLLANRAFLNNGGLEKKEVVGLLVPEVIGKDVFERVVKEKLDESFLGKVVKYEFAHSYPKIGQRDLLVSYFPIEGAVGIERVVCVLHDITDRKRAEATIELERDRAQRYLDIADVILLALDLEGRITLINRKGCSTLGWEEHELLGHEWVDNCLPVRIREELRATFLRLIDGDLSYIENPILTKSGEERMIGWRNTLLRDGQGRVVGTLSSGEDITERKVAEEALRTSEREQRQIAAQLERERARLVEAQEVAKMGSWETDLQTLNVIWSEQTHRIFETDPSHFRPTRAKFREFIHSEDRAKVDTALKASLDKRSPSSVEYRIVMPDGRVKILEERWQTFHDGQEKPVRVAGTCRDITERKRTEEELRLLSGQLLRSQDDERRKIARGLHDSTGQDLVALTMTLSQLNDSIPSSARKLHKSLAICKALTDRCIHEVRTLSYLLHPPMLDEAGLEDALGYFVEGFVQRTGIEVILGVSSNFGRLAPEAELGLFRVVQECLINIQRHSGSFIAEIRLDRGQDQIALSVSDKGHGMSASRRKQNGVIPMALGVGIPSMQERVNQIGGGQLEIESSCKGTTVRVTIPVHD